MNCVPNMLRNVISLLRNLFLSPHIRRGILDWEWQEKNFDSYDILLQLEVRKRIESLIAKQRALLCVELLFREIEQLLEILDDDVLRERAETRKVRSLFQELKSSNCEADIMRSLEKITNSEIEFCAFLSCGPDSMSGFYQVIFDVFEAGGLSLSRGSDPRPAYIAVALHLDFAIGGLPAYEVFDKRPTEPIEDETRFITSLLNDIDKLL
ncbi:MAG: hypothetical protein J0M26_29225 [Planctomycetes bacterium]|nr:hypothetical protein [Planctomycetota bacterium]